MIDYIYLLISLVAMYLSYIFTLVENAYLALGPIKIERLEEEGAANIRLVKKLANSKELYSATLIYDYFSNALTIIFMSLFFYEKWHHTGVIIGIVLSTIIIILIGESLPRNLGKSNYKEIVPRFAKFLNVAIILIRPLSRLLTFLSNSIIKIFLKDKDFEEPIITEEDLKDAMNLSIEEGIINKNESKMIENVIDFKDIYARDIMTPRTDIIGIEIDEDYESIIDKISEYSYSRMPVYEDNLDNIIGILNVKDIFHMDHSKPLSENTFYLKKPFFTFEYKPTGTLFSQMRQNKLSVAIVTDEYGGTEGMITFEDIFERIVGQISDEYDTEEDEDIVNVAPGKYLIDGSVNLDEINKRFDLDLECQEFDSIGGFIIERLDRFPEINEIINVEDIKITIMKSKKNRIEKVLLELPVKAKK